MKHLNLRSKLTFSYAAVFAVLLVAIGGVLYHAMTIRLDHVVDERLRELSAGLWAHMKMRGGEPTLDAQDYFVHTAARRFQLYDAQNGRLLLQSEDAEVVLHSALLPDEVMRRAKEPKVEEIASGGINFRFRSSVLYAGADHPYLLRVGIPLVQVERARRELVKTLLFILPISVLLAGVAGWWMAGKALRPVEELRTAAHNIGILQLNRRLPLRGTRDELDGLAETFNQMFARLEEAVANMKQVTASISHELRTPLAALQGEAEMALMRPESPEEYRRVLASQLEEFHKLSRLINRLLELARAEAGEIQLSNQQFDLSALLRSLGEQMEPIAASQQITLEVVSADSIQLVGDSQWLERAILNLLDNAIKFTPRGGHVRAQANSREEQAVIAISDSGIGIPQSSLPHIFQRFYRVDVSRSKQVDGVGLGLTIAKWIVEAHHGTIEVTSEAGVGSRFTVLLPLHKPIAFAART